MIDSTVLSSLLWAPYLLFLLIYGLIYCISGYKKGLYRSLISVGATVVAGVVSFFAARLMNPLFSGVFTAFQDNSRLELGESLDDFVFGFVFNSLFQSVITLFVFTFLLFVTSMIFKGIASAVTKNKFEPKNSGMRWAGLGVRLVEAVVFSLVLLIPFYGTAGAYVPTVEKIIAVGDISEESGLKESEDVIKTVASHPLVSVSKSGPIAALYNGLSEIKVDDESLNIPKMVSVLGEITDRLLLISEAPNSQKEEAIEELFEYVNDNVVGEKWVYGAYNATIKEVVKVLEAEFDSVSPDAKEIFNDFSDALMMEQDEFDDCLKSVVDFVVFCFDEDVKPLSDNEELKYFHEKGVMSELGKMLNCNKATNPFKRLLITARALEHYDDAFEFTDRYPITKKKDKALQIKEAESIIIMTYDDSELCFLEAMVRHPDFGYDAVADKVCPRVFAELVYEHYDSLTVNPVEKYLEEHPDIYNDLVDRLKACENESPVYSTFTEYARGRLLEILPQVGISGGIAVNGENFVLGDSYVVYMDGADGYGKIYIED